MNIKLGYCSDVDQLVKNSQGDGCVDSDSVKCDGTVIESDGKMKLGVNKDDANGTKKIKFKSPQCDYVIDSFSLKDFAPQSKRKIKWAVGMYCQWREQRLCEGDVPNEIVTADLNCLKELKKCDLSYALCHFVREIKKLDDTEYPPNTLREIVIMIQMYLQQNDLFWKVLDHAEFIGLCNVLHNTTRETTAMGLGVKISSDIISLQNENKLFEVGNWATLTRNNFLTL